MAEVRINAQVQDLARIERIGVHSHIRGLGLDDALESRTVSDGLVGQVAARKAIGIVSRMVKEGRLAGRAVLLAGAPGTGKTALAMALARSLGPETPFANLTASDVFSVDVSRTEALTQAFRRAVGVRVRESSEVIEGEVVEIEAERPSAEGAPRRGRMTLKSTDMETSYDLGARMLEALARARVTAGDVVSIDKATGKVRRLGRSFARARDFDVLAGGGGGGVPGAGGDAEAPGARRGAGPSSAPSPGGLASSGEGLVACPAGELQRTRETEHVVTLHDVDVINSRKQGYLALFSGDTGEIRPEVRSQIDAKVARWREEGRAEIVPGVLFIDEAHALDVECFAFLGRALEAELAPVVVMATNRGVAPVRGSGHRAPHGIPVDLLDRALIVHTVPYAPEEVRAIVALRADEEEVTLEPEALDLLVKIAQETSMRYALQLVAVAGLAAQKRGRHAAGAQDVARTYGLFLDLGRSEAYLKSNPDEYVLNDLAGTGAGGKEETDEDEDDEDEDEDEENARQEGTGAAEEEDKDMKDA